ncbi:MAG: rhomboid family intramembrane serine protease [Hyphomicrobiaceae bacterium]|jgi:membrane associated rhomboid family serine protease|nr:rhomboid family intramembrane serine protease [Hyphomicrobiaceae bacterium]MDX2449048.1 rhomboid family intramembrane serine protease [Hyphomicrobiaceae bacterium]
MFPISDDNPRIGTPYVTWSVIGACVLVFFWQVSLGASGGEIAIYEFGMIPARLLGTAALDPELTAVPAWSTVFTSMFMHGGWLHLGFNMLFLWIFGDNVEDCMGHARYLIFYLVCGVAAALAQAFVSPGSTIPMVGASGAISGVLGAYLLLHPRATVRTVIFLGIFVTMMHLPALIVLGLWFLMQLVSAAFSNSGEAGVAFWAHVGGFVAGMALVPLFKKRDVELFQPPRYRAFQVERQRGPWG